MIGPVTGTQAIFETIGDFLSLGANTVRELQEAIQIAGGEVRTTLQALEGTLADLLNEIEQTYQDNLNITLDSIDAVTRNKLLEVESLMLDVNEMIREDIQLASDEAQEVIQNAALQARALTDDIKRDLQDVVIVAGETGVFLIERTTENLIIIASVILLAIGLIVFVVVLLRGGARSSGFATILGYGLILVFIGFFGALVLLPQFRGFVITSTGIGLREKLEVVTKQPSIFAVLPNVVTVTETEELEIWGSQLTPDGEQPTITIADRPVPIAAISSDRIVLDVSGVVVASAASAATAESLASADNLIVGRDLASDLNLADALPVEKTIRDPITPGLENLFDLIRIDTGVIDVGGGTGGGTGGEGGLELPGGSATLKLDYENFEDITTVVRLLEPTPVLRPADLRIFLFNITPSNVIQRQNATASITVRNDGEMEATNFQLRWKPTATHPGLSTNVSSLAGGASQTFTFNHSYIAIGTFDTVASVDVLNHVEELNEGNNDSQRSIVVSEQPPRRARVTVQFTGVTVHDDADPWPKGKGEIWFTFDVQGSSGRYPTSGTSSIDSGANKNFTSTFDVTLAEGETLHLFINGREADDDSGDDAMGTVNVTYTSGQNWGVGSHSDRSSCPDGCYTIHYTISRTWLD